MIRKEKNGVQWLEFELFAPFPNFRHAILLRHGGHSLGSYASLNVASHVNDDPKAVQANRLKIQETFKIHSLITCNQVHGIEFEWIDSCPPLHPCDAMGTISKNVPLMVMHADCQAAIFYDPVRTLFAVIHSGWRGSVQNIYARVLDEFVRTGSCITDIHAGISPSLGPAKGEFIHYKTELPESFWKFREGNYFDFWAISEHQLRDAGIPKEQIQIARMCTHSNPRDFFSHRREQPRGSHGTLAWLQ
jgi:YfiH family protein